MSIRGYFIILLTLLACTPLCRADQELLAAFQNIPKGQLGPALEKDSGTVAEVYRAANAAFETGDYKNAIGLYEILVEGHQSADLLYLNLGTAYYRDESPGKAALWFRRAAHLKAGMPEIHQNFEFLRREQGLLEFGDQEWQTFLLRCSPTLLKWMGWLALWAALLALLYVIFSKRALLKPLMIVVFIFAGAGTVSLFGLNWYRAHRLAPENFATIIEAETSALIAPAPDSAPVIGLPPGSEVRIIQDTGPWIYAAIPGDYVGWVHHSAMEKNWPISGEKPGLPLPGLSGSQ